MIKAFVVDNDRLRVVDDLLGKQGQVVWADLSSPTKEEEAAIEALARRRHSDARGDGGDRDLVAASMSRTAPIS